MTISDMRTMLLTIDEIHLIQNALDTMRKARRRSAAHTSSGRVMYHTDLENQYEALLDKFRIYEPNLDEPVEWPEDAMDTSLERPDYGA